MRRIPGGGEPKPIRTTGQTFASSLPSPVRAREVRRLRRVVGLTKKRATTLTPTRSGGNEGPRPTTAASPAALLLGRALRGGRSSPIALDYRYPQRRRKNHSPPRNSTARSRVNG